MKVLDSLELYIFVDDRDLKVTDAVKKRRIGGKFCFCFCFTFLFFVVYWFDRDFLE